VRVRMSRAFVVIALLVSAVSAARADYLADKARPIVEASHAEIRAVHLGRYMARGRWEEILDETLYTLAPKGTWGPKHPAWPAARVALAKVLREASVEKLRGETGEWVRRVVNERYSSLEPDAIAAAAAFYESPGGKVFRAYRELVLADEAYGLPYVIETVSREELQRRREDARQKLLNLPDEQTSAVYEFNHSKTGELLLGIENNIIADVIGNIMRSDIASLLSDEGGVKIARAVRAAVPGMPAESAKVYLGNVTMRADRTLDVVIEYHDAHRLAGTYSLSYAPGALHWQDVANGVPGIAPGETRYLYRDPRGRLSDAP
jgi:hypothetical protein